eukprot:sb/3477417/
MKLFILVILCTSLLVTPGDCKKTCNKLILKLWRDLHFKGPKIILTEDTPLFKAIGFDNQVSSYEARCGTQWECFFEENYQGTMLKLRGMDYFMYEGWNDKISSCRRIK